MFDHSSLAAWLLRYGRPLLRSFDYSAIPNYQSVKIDRCQPALVLGCYVRLLCAGGIGIIVLGVLPTLRPAATSLSVSASTYTPAQPEIDLRAGLGCSVRCMLNPACYATKTGKPIR